MICKICLKEKKLIKAHIYPEWIYRALYPNGKVEGLSLLVVASNNPKFKKARIGIYDDQILCSDCDNQIGFFDSIGKTALMEDKLKLFKDLGSEGKVYTINNINPTQLKIFFLSMLLRACLSNRDEYKNIYLPNQFIDRLKEITMGKLEISLDEFSVLITKFRSRQLKDEYKKYSQTPYQNRIDGINFFTLNLPNGFKAYIKVDQRPVIAELLPFIIRPNYPIYIIEHEYFEESKEFNWLKTSLTK